MCLKGKTYQQRHLGFKEVTSLLLDEEWNDDNLARDHSNVPPHPPPPMPHAPQPLKIKSREKWTESPYSEIVVKVTYRLQYHRLWPDSTNSHYRHNTSEQSFGR